MPVVSTRLAQCKYIPFNDLRLALCGLTAIPGQFGTQVQHHEWKIYTVISPLVTCVHRLYLAPKVLKGSAVRYVDSFVTLPHSQR
jgi:hypothetical protein